MKAVIFKTSLVCLALALPQSDAAAQYSFKARTTGVEPGDTAEFFIITENSGHDYEALFISETPAKDIRAAVLKMGLPEGEGVDYEKFKFHPKGERVHMSVKFPGAEKDAALDSLVMDSRTGEPLRRTGFVFVGSDIPDNAGPGSIVSSYNEPATLFDVPRRCIQGDVYEKFRVAKGFPTNKNVTVEIIITPEGLRQDGSLRPRLMDLDVAFSPKGIAVGKGVEPDSAQEAIAKLRGFAEAGRDVFVAPLWDDALTIEQIRNYARLLKLLDADDGVRVGPPAKDDPYYQAFNPPDGWRVREDRFAQPCELRFGADGAATLVAIEESWKDGELKPDLKITELPGVTAESLPKLMKGRDNDLAVLLVFAPAGLRYDAVRPFITAIKATHPNLHLFAE